MQIIISISLSILSALLLTLCSLKPLQIFQLSSYKARGYFAWLKRTRFDFFVRCFALTFFCAASVFIFIASFPKSYWGYIGIAFYIGLSIFFIVIQKREKQKTPLRFTNRIIRQIIIISVLYAGLCFIAVYFLAYAGDDASNSFINYGLIALMPLLVPFVPILSHYIALPAEKLNALRYKKKARKVLDSSDIIKIGITGSYGKTTAKNILFQFLSKKYKVLTSPQSHNTPMGLCKLINQGVDGYEIFIAEMGARHTGDIKELCNLITPDYGVVTQIGEQHLETFGSIKNIIKTKLDLARHAKDCIIIDDKNIKEEIEKDKVLSAKVKDNQLTLINEDDIKNIKISADGTTFDLSINGKIIRINTPLLGRHIPLLIAQCATLAHKMGITEDEIIESAITLKPIEHRLQLIKSEKAIIIDDAYNSNPQGAKNALEVLSAFNSTKVVITPGFIELGKLQAESNYKLGQEIAKTADYLFCIKNPDIIKGAKDQNMDEAKILACTSLDDAMNKFSVLTHIMPVVLFLNDLPDNY